MSDRVSDKVTDKSAQPGAPSDLNSGNILKEAPQAQIVATDLLKDFPRCPIDSKPFTTAELLTPPQPDAKTTSMLSKTIKPLPV